MLSSNHHQVPGVPLRCAAYVAGLLCLLALGVVACEIEPFDPRGYHCETDINCLPDYYCNKAKKLCELVPQKESPPQDASEAPPEARAEPPSERRTIPREPPPERRGEPTTPDLKTPDR